MSAVEWRVSLGDDSTRVVYEPATSSFERAVFVCAHGAVGRVLFGSFVELAMAPPRARGCATLATRREIATLIPGSLLGVRSRRAHPYSALSLSPSYKGIPLPIGGLARTCGVPVHVWSVNDMALAVRLWRAGVQSILSDDPGAIVRARTTLTGQSS